MSEHRLSALPPTVASLGRLLVFGLTFLLCVGVSAGAQESDSKTNPTAQGTTGSGIFSDVVNVRVVNVEVFVTDRDGVPIEGLSQEDFSLEVDGQSMPVTNFYAEKLDRTRSVTTTTGRPADTSFRPIEEVEKEASKRAHVVILIDHTRLRSTNRKRVFSALAEAVNSLDPSDLISVVGVEGSLVFYSDFIYDRAAIGKILDRVSKVSGQLDIADAERRLIYGELARGQSGGFLARSANPDDQGLNARIRAYATEEHARSLRSLNQIERVISSVAGVPGRKAILWVGEGIPTRPGEGMFVEWRNRFGEGNSNAGVGLRRIDFNNDYTRSVGNYDLTRDVEKVALTANRAQVTLYAVDAEGNHGQILRSALTEQGATSEALSVVDANYREPLEFTTQATGGKLLRDSGRLGEELRTLIRDFESFYSLGFTIPEAWPLGSEHNIEVRVRGKQLRVRHRDEIRVPKPGEKEASATVSALLHGTFENALGIVATTARGEAREDGNTAISVVLEIPIAGISLVPTGDVFAASLSIFVSVKDDGGNPGKVQKIPFHLNIPADKVDEAKQNSAHYPLPIVLRPGDRQVAISVKDDVDGTLSTVRLDVASWSSSD